MQQRCTSFSQGTMPYEGTQAAISTAIFVKGDELIESLSVAKEEEEDC